MRNRKRITITTPENKELLIDEGVAEIIKYISYNFPITQLRTTTSCDGLESTHKGYKRSGHIGFVCNHTKLGEELIKLVESIGFKTRKEDNVIGDSIRIYLGNLSDKEKKKRWKKLLNSIKPLKRFFPKDDYQYWADWYYQYERFNGAKKKIESATKLMSSIFFLKSYGITISSDYLNSFRILQEIKMRINARKMGICIKCDGKIKNDKCSECGIKYDDSSLLKSIKELLEL
jgi:hypothetical protein